MSAGPSCGTEPGPWTRTIGRGGHSRQSVRTDVCYRTHPRVGVLGVGAARVRLVAQLTAEGTVLFHTCGRLRPHREAGVLRTELSHTEVAWTGRALGQHDPCPHAEREWTATRAAERPWEMQARAWATCRWAETAEGGHRAGRQEGWRASGRLGDADFGLRSWTARSVSLSCPVCSGNRHKSVHFVHPRPKILSRFRE